MWLANFEDGSSVSSKETFWTHLPKDKKLRAVQLTHPHLPKFFISISDKDKFYFVTEAIVEIQGEGTSTPTVVAEIIGGVDLDSGICTEIRLCYTGSAKVRTFPFSQYKYSEEILVEGFKKNK